MKIDFNNIVDHIISMDDFQLKWRFTNERYDKLPDEHLDQLKPLDKAASEFIWNFITTAGLHNDMPFKKDLFLTIETAKITDDNEREIKLWLFDRGLPFDKPVVLSWNKDNSMIVPWKLLIKYYDSFYYPISDDLTVVDKSLNWGLLFFHEHEIHFGTNTNFTSTKIFADVEFLW